MKRSLVLADTEFLLGALLDVCVRSHIWFPESRIDWLIESSYFLAPRDQMSYVWLFYDSADWSMPIITLYIVHSLLWLHCSLIQLGGKDQGLISHFFYVCFIFHNQSKCVCSIRTNHPSYSHYFGLSLLSFPSR
jgi:hypothetical protein